MGIGLGLGLGIGLRQNFRTGMLHVLYILPIMLFQTQN